LEKMRRLRLQHPQIDRLQNSPCYTSNIELL
jgi:hypothetical protein